MNHFTKSMTSVLCSAITASALLLGAPTQASADQISTTFPLLAPVLEGKLNINTASQKQWELLPGIGPATAKRIVAYRSKHAFAQPLHLMRVKGIGRKTFNAVKPYLSIKGETTLHQVGKAKGRSPSK